jgi:hypothetical protein
LTAELQLRNDYRVGCLGRQGSGKTELMRMLLDEQPRVIIVDDKHRVNFPGYYLTSDPTAALLEPKTIFRPTVPINSNWWEDAMDVLHKAGGGIIYIDELAEQCSASRMAAGLKSVLRMGRVLGVGLWWSAQSATEIYNTAIRQSDILIMFLNVGASDRDKMIKIAGDIAEVTAHLELYDFVVFESANQTYDPEAIPAYRLPRELVVK